MQVEPYPEPQAEPQSEPVEDMESLLEEHSQSYALKRGDIRTGHIIGISSDGALIDIGQKREGFVPAQDLRQAERTDMGEVHVGDEVHVMIVDTQTDDGYVGLSIYRARLEEDWVKAEKLLESNEIYEGTISGYNRGGLTVQFGRIRGFIPLSHVVGMPRGLKEQDRRQQEGRVSPADLGGMMLAAVARGRDAHDAVLAVGRDHAGGGPAPVGVDRYLASVILRVTTSRPATMR